MIRVGHKSATKTLCCTSVVIIDNKIFSWVAIIYIPALKEERAGDAGMARFRFWLAPSYTLCQTRQISLSFYPASTAGVVMHSSQMHESGFILLPELQHY